MHAPSLESVGRYLEGLKGRPVRVLDVVPLAGADGAADNGNGALRIDFEISGRRQRAILETLGACAGPCEHTASLARDVVSDHRDLPRLPRHVRAIDVGALEKGGRLVSLGRAEEFFLLKDCAEGRPYTEDLARAGAHGVVEDLDTARCDALCDWLLRVHAQRGTIDPSLYSQRLRGLLGREEGVMVLADAWPETEGGLAPAALEEIERRLIGWRWRIKGRSHRLRGVHGEFRPDHVLFREGCDFSVIGRAHGEWGEPADDVACMTLHFVVEALRHRGRFDGPLKSLFRRFWSRYLLEGGDGEILEVAPPFLAWRGLELASPARDAGLSPQARRTMTSFVCRVIAEPVFDPELMDTYLGA
ncbi:MAG TPA: hypothetical protein VF139_08010 [Candidatus Polarisedimenticolaceae bacterium]